jgi:2-polyprenyl-3-methyl-5-hydroxy-6-metoxy-1,4-benzoquinol methylase
MLPLLPEGTRRVLELGCGEGGFGALVKKARGAECWAIEFQPEVAARAEGRLDRVLVGDADQCIPQLPDGYFDAIVANDVLEHLPYPWVTLEKLKPKLSPQGVVVTSIPNIRHMAALATILFLRDFPQCDQGIFDRTHLRFFTKKSIKRMFDQAGYDLLSIEGRNRPHPLALPFTILITILSLGLLSDTWYFQYACVASPRR